MKKFYSPYFLSLIIAAMTIFYTLSSCKSGNNSIEQKLKTAPVTKVPNNEGVRKVPTVIARYNGNDEMARILNKLQADAHNVTITGKYDMDHAKLMSLFHMAAVELIGYQLRSGEDEKLKELTTEMLKAEKKSMSDLIGVVRELRLKAGDQKDTSISKTELQLSKELFETMNGVIDSMQTTVSTGDIDSDFIALILPYQNAALEVSKVAKKKSDHVKIKKISSQIITDKEVEISKLNKLVKTSGGEIASLNK